MYSRHVRTRVCMSADISSTLSLPLLHIRIPPSGTWWLSHFIAQSFAAWAHTHTHTYTHTHTHTQARSTLGPWGGRCPLGYTHTHTHTRWVLCTGGACPDMPGLYYMTTLLCGPLLLAIRVGPRRDVPPLQGGNSQPGVVARERIRVARLGLFETKFGLFLVVWPRNCLEFVMYLAFFKLIKFL